MFKKNKLYRHRNSLDIDLFVVSDPIDKGDRYLLEVKYWNRNYKIFQPTDFDIDNIIIKKDNINNWSEL